MNGLVENRRKKTTNQYAEEERWVFSFDLKEVRKMYTPIKGETQDRTYKSFDI